MPKFLKEGISQAEKDDADAKVRKIVEDILENIKSRGDDALLEYSNKFDSFFGFWIFTPKLDDIAISLRATIKPPFETSWTDSTNLAWINLSTFSPLFFSFKRLISGGIPSVIE